MTNAEVFFSPRSRHFEICPFQYEPTLLLVRDRKKHTFRFLSDAWFPVLIVLIGIKKRGIHMANQGALFCINCVHRKALIFHTACCMWVQISRYKLYKWRKMSNCGNNVRLLKVKYFLLISKSVLRFNQVRSGVSLEVLREVHNIATCPAHEQFKRSLFRNKSQRFVPKFEPV